MNKKTKIAILSIIALVLVTIGITYAYWLVTRTQTGENVISTGCLDIELNGSGDINLTEQFPISDDEGKELEPYTFTVTNNCTTSVDYHINLESIGTESSAINSAAIKAVLNENTPKVLYDYVGATTTITNAYAAHTLGYGTLAGKSDTSDEDEATYELRLWIDENAPISEMNKTYTGKISVIIGQGISSQGTNLSTLILADAETNGYLKTDTPDFTQTIADGEYGLYSTEDDYGTSYYFHGDVENNYVNFGSGIQDVYSPVFDLSLCENGEECLAIADLVYNDLGTCLLSGEAVEGWSTCEKKSLESIYYSDSGFEEELSGIGFMSKDMCEKAKLLLGESSTQCTEINRTENYTWRIVRINGDGTIRLIYDTYHNYSYDSQTLSLAIIGTAAYNSIDNDNKHVGYIYDEDGVQTDSNIKTVVETWYEEKLEENYSYYIADRIFCNDRSDSNSDGDYDSYDRLHENANPKIICSREEDKLTVLNGQLSKPIGLITADEIAMAGGLSMNPDNPVYIKSFIDWTMTPSSNLHVWLAIENGLSGANAMSLSSTYGVRPVINIKADVLFAGSGTEADPYKLITE